MARWDSKQGQRLLQQWLPRLVSGGGAALLLVVFVGLPNLTLLSCQKAAGQLAFCQVRTMSLVGIPWGTRNLRPLLGANLNLGEVAKAGYVYRVKLYDLQGEIPMTRYSLNAQTAYGTLQRIRGFLQSMEGGSLRLWQHAPIAILVAVGMVGVGLVALGYWLALS